MRAGFGRGAALALCALLSVPALAQTTPPGGGFSLPLDCRPGQDCWVMNLVDVDPGPAARDFTCGPQTYDGHKGTDIAIRDRAAMGRGVPVLAAAAGVVLRGRDGEPDGPPPAGRTVSGRECGNGMIVDHGGGWTSQYCHLRRGSVAVRPGTRVARGQRLGLVGQSGLSEFPHLHIGFRQNGALMDPYTGRRADEGCGAKGTTLWRTGAAPRPGGALYAAGFATGAVTAAMVRRNAGSPATLPKDAPALVLWGAVFGIRRNDVLQLVIVGPGRRAIVRRTARLDRDRAWHIAFSGRKRPPGGWRSGVYRGAVRFLRNGRERARRIIDVTLR